MCPLQLPVLRRQSICSDTRYKHNRFLADAWFVILIRLCAKQLPVDPELFPDLPSAFSHFNRERKYRQLKNCSSKRAPGLNRNLSSHMSRYKM